MQIGHKMKYFANLCPVFAKMAAPNTGGSQLVATDLAGAIIVPLPLGRYRFK